MRNKIRYTCHAVIKGCLVEDKIIAVSDAQAEYFFCKNNSFKIRDFKIIGRESLMEQMTFNI